MRVIFNQFVRRMKLAQRQSTRPITERPQVRFLHDVSHRTRSSRQSCRFLPGMVQVQVLPGAMKSRQKAVGGRQMTNCIPAYRLLPTAY